MKLINEDNRKWWVLSATTLTLGMVFIDQTIVNVSLPTIQRDFQASDIALQWIINAYLLPLACFLIVGGRLGDIFGSKKLFLLGMVIFVLSSFFCGFAKNENWLIISRACQGLGGSILIPSLMATFFHTVHAKERGKFLGLQAGIAGVFLALGPFLGGLITETWNWRWIFWLNIPIGFAAFILATISVKKTDKLKKDEKVDFLGLAVLTLGLFCVVVALMEGENWNWLTWKTMGLFLIGLILLLSLFFIEPRQKDPLIDFSLFKDRLFLCGIIVVACLNVALISSVFSTIYTQSNLGFTPLESGTLMLPAILPIFIMTPIAGKLHDVKGPFIPVTIGMLLVAMGMCWIAIFCYSNQYIYFLPGLIIYGLGIANVMSPISAAALTTIPAEKRGVASGIMSAMRQIGGSIGLAIVGALLVFGQRHQFAKFLQNNKLFSKVFQAQDASEILNGTAFYNHHVGIFSPPEILQLKEAAMFSFNFGFSIAMGFTTIVCIIGMIVAWFFLRPNEKKSNEYQ